MSRLSSGLCTGCCTPWPCPAAPSLALSSLALLTRPLLSLSHDCSTRRSRNDPFGLTALLLELGGGDFPSSYLGECVCCSSAQALSADHQASSLKPQARAENVFCRWPYEFPLNTVSIDPSFDPAVETPIAGKQAALLLTEHSLAGLSERCCAGNNPAINGSFRVVGNTGECRAQPLDSCYRQCWLSSLCALLAHSIAFQPATKPCLHLRLAVHSTSQLPARRRPYGARNSIHQRTGELLLLLLPLTAAARLDPVQCPQVLFMIRPNLQLNAGPDTQLQTYGGTQNYTMINNTETGKPWAPQALNMLCLLCCASQASLGLLKAQAHAPSKPSHLYSRRYLLQTTTRSTISRTTPSCRST